MISHILKIRSNLSAGLYRSLVVQEFDSPRISKNSAHEGAEVVIPTHRSSLPPSLGFISVRD